MKLLLHRAAPENNGYVPADPGDFGCGPYYTTAYARARCHGPKVESKEFEFKNPLVLDVKDAYDISEDFGTLHGTLEQRQFAARRLTQSMINLGYDALVVKHPRDEYEVLNLKEVRL